MSNSIRIKSFKVGDEVVVDRSFSTRELQGKTGIVRHIKHGTEAGIEFDFDFNGGWNMEGRCINDDDRGYYISFSYLKLAFEREKKVLISYKAGMNITDYVKRLLKVEKDKERVKWLRTFDNCVLPKGVRDTIEEALTVVLRADMFEKWGINDHFEKGLTNSILIYGPPGTGKTMVSESIASVLNMNLMKLTNAEIQSNIPGRTEKNITDSFSKAKKQNAVMMFDECDSMLYNRNSVGAILSAEINHLLMEIENFDGVVILTTNRLHKLDEALQRRIIARIELPFPDKETRELIWEKLIPPKLPTEKLNFKKLAIAELSGGEIKNSILLSARKAIAQNRKKVTISDFNISIDNILKAKAEFKAVQPTQMSEYLKKDMDKV